MILTIRDLLALTAAGALLVLSLATVYYCRASRIAFASEPTFLFGALGRPQSLASNTGSVFSVTYFFGATFMYAAVFHGWIRIMTLIVFFAVLGVTTAITRVLHSENVIGTAIACNPLLAVLQRRLDAAQFSSVVRLYTVIYFALLVEELAVSRLVLYSLIPHPIVVGVLLVALLFVIYTYLYLGGFRAVLAADTVQMVVLILFTATLLLLVFSRSTPASFLIGHFERQSAANLLNLAGSFVFGVAWFAGAIDFYSRLNFSSPQRYEFQTSRHFVIASCSATFAVLLVGTVFGDFISRRLTVRTPSAYVAEAIEFFLGEPLAVAVIFIVAIFAMIFTTIDTLLILNLQVGNYQPKRVFRRETLVHIIVAAVVISTRMSFDSVSAVGIFIGALMLLPMLAIVRTLWPSRLRWLPDDPQYLVWAMWLAMLAFAILYSRIVVRFDRHFYLSLIVAAIALVCAASSQVIGLLRRTRG